MMVGGADDAAPTPMRRRWLMLAVFCLVALSNGFQWIQFAIITESVSWYYDVSEQAVAWTALSYMAAYAPCILPASWLLDRKGLRWTVIAAALGNFVAGWLKVVAVRQDLFSVLMLGQAVAAVTQVFVISVPPRLAAVWFGAQQVSTACAVGVFGNQVGNALGFLVPAVLVDSPNTVTAQTMGDDLRLVAYIVAGFSSVSLLVVLLVFEASPRVAPSAARAAAEAARGDTVSLRDFVATLRELLFKSPGFVLLFGAYSISTGVCFAASILLDKLVLSVFPGSDDAGYIGMVMILSGLVGSVLCGLLLDATGKFKQVTVGVYSLSVLAVCLFTASLTTGTVWPVYVTGALAGFFLAGYVPVGFEFAAELTYPTPEGTSAGLLTAGAQLLGVVLVLGCGELLNQPQGALWTCGTMAVALVLGAGLTAAIPPNLRRLEAQQHKQQPPVMTTEL